MYAPMDLVWPSLRGYDNPGLGDISHALYVLYGKSRFSQCPFGFCSNDLRTILSW